MPATQKTNEDVRDKIINIIKQADIIKIFSSWKSRMALLIDNVGDESTVETSSRYPRKIIEVRGPFIRKIYGFEIVSRNNK